MANFFQFKQFGLDQTHCAMKVNTDGVVLGAWAAAESPQYVLDIGTGTGVIALMLAQRYPKAEIDAVEIDKLAATTAAVNFQASPFVNRLKAFPLDIAHYFMLYPDKKFDLIVTNPPFFIDDLKSADQAKGVARHTDRRFFETLLDSVVNSLSEKGRFCLVLPPDTATWVQRLAQSKKLQIHELLQLKSFPDSAPHRYLLSLGFGEAAFQPRDLVIYQAEKSYHPDYHELLQNFLTIF